MTPVRLKPTTPLSGDKQSTTEPLCSLNSYHDGADNCSVQMYHDRIDDADNGTVQ